MRALLHKSAVSTFLAALLLTGTAPAWAAEAPDRKPGRSGPQEAERLAKEIVEHALLAEAAGQPQQRSTLIKQAIDIAPGYAPARWQAGMVRWQGKWLPIDEVTQATARDPQRLEYAKLRAKQASSSDAQRQLAQWCLKHKLDAEAKFHFRKLLEFEPDDAQALRELGLHPYEGELLTKAEIASRRKDADSRQRGLVYWKPRLTAWRRDIASLDQSVRDVALSQIRATIDVEVIGAFEAILAGSDPAANSTFELEMVGVLGRMDDARATFALVREAALSQWPDVQEAAAGELKRHELTDYVPYALANMSTLYESKYMMTVDPNGAVHYQQRTKRQRAEADDVGLNQTNVVPAIGMTVGKKEATGRDEQYAAELASGLVATVRHRRVAANESRWNAFADAQKLAASDDAVVAELNHVVDTRNAAIQRLLLANAGADVGEDPKAWWDWWTNYNEMHYSPERRTNYYGSESNYYDYVRYNGLKFAGGGLSCFIAGTPVWTLSGPRSIEEIQPGDRVLAQDPQTGELDFKTVLQTTIRPASPTRILEIGTEQIVATRGHRFWQVGRGWQMSKQLEAPAMLHSASGARPLESATDGEDAVAHNLVVADFHTYFVGQNRILVHDNSAPKPVLGTVPGLVERDRSAAPPATAKSNP